MKASMAVVALAARALATEPQIHAPSHACRETMSFADIVWPTIRDSDYPRKSYDWDRVFGQGPVPGAKFPFPDMHVKTKPMETEVVDLKVSNVPEIKKAILKRTAVFQGIKDIMDQQMELYHNYNLNFDNSILFVPQWMDFYIENQAVTMAKFPQAVSVAGNIFHVPAGNQPFGIHNAEHAATAILRPVLTYWERLVKTHETGNQHVSFWTALDDILTPEDQPLIIYEKMPPTVSNVGYMLRVMKGAPNIDKVRMDMALSAIESGQTAILQPAISYITSVYLNYKFCPQSNPEGDAYWWPLKAGQALHFDNYVFHGGSSLGKSTKDRFTMDMRVTTYRLNSCNMSAYYHQNRKVSAMFQRSKTCISKIFGYDDYNHLLTVMYGPEVAAVCANAPMFFFAANPVDLERGFVDDEGDYPPYLFITPTALKKHMAFASHYFETDDFTMPEAARACIDAEN